MLKSDFISPRGNTRVMRFSIETVAKAETYIPRIKNTENQSSLPSTEIRRLLILGSIKVLNRSLITFVYSAISTLILLNSLMGFTQVPIPIR